MQSVVSAYAVASSGFLLFGGRAADLLGRRRILITGLALSSATILFILHAWLTQREMSPGHYGLAVAFGPGFSAELLLMQWC